MIPLLTHDGELLGCTHGDDGHIEELMAQETPIVAQADVPAPKVRCAAGDDGVSGYRAKALYVYPDGTVPNYTADAFPIRVAISQTSEYVRKSAQKYGRNKYIRWEHDGECNIALPMVALPSTAFADMNSTINALRALGYTNARYKYVMFTTASNYCGVGSASADSSPTTATYTNNSDGGVPGYSRIDAGCRTPYAVVHELFHNLGAVNPIAPNATAFYHCIQGNDVMCYNDGTLRADQVMFYPCPTALLDCLDDDYFSTSPTPKTYLQTHWNTANSRFLFDTAVPMQPDVPTSTGAFTGTGSATVYWSPPSADNGSPITGYTVTQLPNGPTYQLAPTATSLVVNGLTPSTAYTFQVTANNAFGSSVPAQPTVTITASIPPTFTAAPQRFTPISPLRVLDTRSGIGAASLPLSAGSTIALQITGIGGLPSGASTTVLNLTATGSLDGGFVTVYPCNTTRPDASNLNFTSAQTIANLVNVRLDPAGRTCIYTSATTHLLADIAGYHSTSGSLFTSITPGRVLDTRSGIGAPVGRLAGGQVLTLQVTGVSGVPVGATTAVLNLTVTNPTDAGYITAYPCGSTRPEASNINFLSAQTIANLVDARLDSAGRVCIYTTASTHLLADIAGHYSSTGALFTPIVPSRLLDTRSGTGAPAGPVAAAQTLTLQVTGRGGIPTGATGAVLNLTVTSPSEAGYITAYPCNALRPQASNLNFVSGQTIANLVDVRLDASGRMCLFSTAGTHVLADVAGFHS